jgi:hypothetical protein
MEQRPLRLGDILDDYCPRERRVTNHAVVAMVEEDVKQTRCTTCDTEHVYKGGKAPRRKKSESTGKLYKQVLAGLTEGESGAVAVPDAVSFDDEPAAPEPVERLGRAADDAPLLDAGDDEADELDADVDQDDEQPRILDEGPVHRPLIRAQLPRVEGVKLERQAPDFTIRQANGRGNFRGHGHNGNGNGNGNGHRFGRGPHRGNGRGGGQQAFGRGPGGQQQRSGGGRKRGR